jgi:sn-glycerol 3-phosphate transport system substrate-binding protein
VAMTTSWPTWIQLEEFSALHDLPFASQQNGFGGLDTQLEIASRQHVTQVQRLLDMAKAGTFTYAGRDNAPDPLLLSGQAGIAFNSSGIRGALAKSAKFDWGVGYLPYDPALIKTPLNSIIGGASLWAMTAPSRSTEEYRAVAQFLAFLGRPENDAAWHQATGYVPVTLAGFELSQQQGFYSRNPGADLPVKQLARGQVTSNSKGLRLGRLLEIRNIIQEELEKALQGGQSAQQAMEVAVSRGDRVLREFQKSVKA